VALVLALGNPGARYARTRHNVGWWVADELVARWKAPFTGTASLWNAWRARVGDAACDVVEPLTFMNLSGEALVRWREKHPFEPGELLVLSDDVYLPAGAIRLRAGGSSGGHKGLESVERALGTREFARLRIGVGERGEGALREHVLETFEEDDERKVKEAVLIAADAVETWLREGLTAAMNRYNRRTTQEEQAP
jgi:PTH1 family peptidyl-tRNA hydrolase